MFTDISHRLVSVIIPVYNLADYITQCVASINNPEEPNVEIILVDDGSTDGSSQKCDDLSKKYDNVKVIHKINGGVSSARNTGLKEAKGEWLFFIDGDDLLSPQTITTLRSSFNNDIDLIHFGWNHVEGDIIGRYQISNERQWYTLKEVCKNNVFDGYVWSFVFRRNIIINNKIFFSTDVKYAEDWEFIIHYYCNIKNKIAVLPHCLYYQIQRVGSATQQELGEKYLIDNFNMFRRVLEVTKDDGELYKMVIRKLHLLIKWLANNVIYSSSNRKMLQRIYKREWMSLLNSNSFFALHPLVFLPGFVNQKCYFYLCRVMRLVSCKES